MKRILNKMICFMWGHEYEEYFWLNRARTDELYSLPNLVKIYYCKHCGAHKHD